MSVTRDIDHSFTANSAQNTVIQRAAIDFRGSVHDRAIALRDLVIASNQSERAQEQALIAKLQGNYVQAQQQLQQVLSQPHTAIAPEVPQLIASIEQIEKAGLQTAEQMLQAIARDDRSFAQQLLWTQAKPQYTEWLRRINQLVDFEENLIKHNNQQAKEAAMGFGDAMVWATLAGLLISVITALALARSITRELGGEPYEVKAAVQSLQQGDLTTQVPLRAGDSSSIMAAVHALQLRFHELVSAVHSNIYSLRSTGSEIAQGSQRLSERNLQTGSSLNETSREMQNLTALVHDSYQAALQAEQRAAQALEAASRGGTVMKQVVETMSDIEQSSHHIEQIIGVIDGIAFQTNILALNAAVEAARAGEQGRGFAVVASEVRSLAGRSAEAAKQIKQLISNSVQRVDMGTSLVAQAGTTVQDIVSQVEQVHHIIGTISQASQQQSKGIAQVNLTVTELDAMTQENATLAQQSATTVDHLQSEAASLHQLASAFQVHQRTPQTALLPA